MTKHSLILTASVATLIGTAAFAGPVEDLVAQLRAEGYQKIEVETGGADRVKVEAENGMEEREIYMVASTGEILSDMADVEDDDDRDEDDDDRDDDYKRGGDDDHRDADDD